MLCIYKINEFYIRYASYPYDVIINMQIFKNVKVRRNSKHFWSEAASLTDI